MLRFYCAIQVALTSLIFRCMRVSLKKIITCKRVGCNNIVGKNAFIYCSNKCCSAFHHEEYIQRWLSGEIEGTTTSFDKPSGHIKTYMIATYGEKCCVCGWDERNPHTGRIPIHIDHIDGNARNNRPENLRFLCPNHHSLTPTFGNANRGRGRAVRRARYIKGIKSTDFSPLIAPKRLSSHRLRLRLHQSEHDRRAHNEERDKRH